MSDQQAQQPPDDRKTYVLKGFRGEGPSRAVGLLVQVEVFENDDSADDIDLVLVRARLGPVIEHITREGGTDVVDVDDLAGAVTSQLHQLVANVYRQLDARYGGEE